MIPYSSSALLISDLHLTPSMPLTAQRFFDFCEKEAPKVEAVFILGDLFECWVGDDAAAQSPFQQEVQRAIANLSTKVKTYYLHGNRDFLIGQSFIKKTGMTLLSDPTTVDIASKKWVLAHGDALCTADTGYQVFRGWVRKPWIQKIFLSLPLNWRKKKAPKNWRFGRQARYLPTCLPPRWFHAIRRSTCRGRCCWLPCAPTPPSCPHGLALIWVSRVTRWFGSTVWCPVKPRRKMPCVKAVTSTHSLGPAPNHKPITPCSRKNSKLKSWSPTR